jgi:hypothetical protein
VSCYSPTLGLRFVGGINIVGASFASQLWPLLGLLSGKSSIPPRGISEGHLKLFPYCLFDASYFQISNYSFMFLLCSLLFGFSVYSLFFAIQTLIHAA